MSNHYMRSSMYSLKSPTNYRPSRLSHEDEDPFRHILINDEEEEPQHRYQPYRRPSKSKSKSKSNSDLPPRQHRLTYSPSVTRPNSSVSSRSSTESSKSFTELLTEKTRQLLSQFSFSNNKSPIQPPTQLQLLPMDDRSRANVNRTIHYIRSGSYIPDYVPIEPPQPAVPRRDRMSMLSTTASSSTSTPSPISNKRTSVYSSHCLMSGNAPRRSSRYFQ